ncbi:dihydroneopterin triphosphate diphosphatase [Pseudoalteromonas luteoviolacea]|uniref:dihydroneopterin triphosphate diphosphatase n=1 Tax=Pseudoalteromonas luteoviolacea TaxID=43657 RepID=UPI00114D8A55|nr:dihydroneopterin triphosphate diphosphatase [Pseudoalteromonas luteoviolacea]TQF67585.1 dihydroneopterin triphosphate diphosphatase [Pseudoalteromonas luteoviolacea]
MTMLRQPASVLVVIYNENKEFLLLQRKDDSDFWQSVTGGIDHGELSLDTAYRELKEETGIDAKALNLKIKQHNTQNQYEIRPQWRHRYIKGALINTEYVFSICIPNSTPVTLCDEEHTDFIWLSKEDAAKKVWSQSNRKEILAIS